MGYVLTKEDPGGRIYALITPTHLITGDMKDMIAHYNDYQKNLANDIPEIPAEDAPYGLSGEATPWDTASGERLSDGGADQKWLPLTVDDFEKMGIFKEK